MDKSRFSRKAIPAWVVLGVGVLASVITSLQVRQAIEKEAVEQFAFASDQVALKVRERLQSYELILRGGAARFAGAESVDRRKWRSFVEKLQADRIVPGVQGIGFAQVIPADRLAAHIAAVRAGGFPEYSVRPAGPREVYTSIVYLEPFRDRNLRAFGYDMFSEPVRRLAMERARDSGDAELSGKVELVQETETDVQAGTLMYVAVYRNGMPVDTVEQRRAALVGWVYSPYRMKDLMSGILQGWESREGRYVDLHIYDGHQAAPASLLFDSFSGSHPNPNPLFNLTRTVDFHGHPWLLEFDRLPTAPGISYLPVWLALAGGFSLSGLVCILLFSLLNTRENAARIAAGLTAEIREHERLLQESEYRWRFAIEGSGDGLWDWNVAEGTVFYSWRWKKMLGYEESEVGNGLDEWQKRIHPDDSAETLAVMEAYLKGETPLYVSEHRVRCRDGSYIWILDRGMVVSRSDDGKPLRMIGTHKDITDRRLLEDSLRQNRMELLEAQRITRAGSWKLDLATQQVFWTAELYRMLGLDPDVPPPDMAAQRGIFSPASYEQMCGAVRRAMESGMPYELELEMIRADGAHGWMLARGEAVRNADGKIVELRGISLDITERVVARIRIEHLTKLYAALSECNSAIVHCATQDELFARICQVVVHHGGMKMAWIGLVDEPTGRIVPVESYGEGTDYLDGILITVNADDPHGMGPTGSATRENRPVWFDDFVDNPLTAPWRERGAGFGWRASAALPLARNHKPVGALTFYATTSGWFDEETRALLLEMAADISFALDKLDAEAEAKSYQATLIESEQRFRSLVEQSIAGAFIIQDGAIVYANPRLVQILGYSTGDEVMGRSPLEFIDPKDRARIAENMRKLSSGEVTKTDTAFTALRKDGATVEVGTNSSLAHYQSRAAIIGLVQDMADKKVAEDQVRRYARQLEHTFIQTVGLATTLSEMRDPYTVGHEQRVAEIAVAIGKELGLDENRLEGLRIGGYLHDVGKITIPSEILSKPARLSTNEFALIKEHARAGYDVLKGVDFPWPVAQIAFQHHERLDGTGYPNGLKGDEIILEARITAVADVVESMASHRPYRPAVGLDKALGEIERGMGTSFDREVAAACLRLFREKGYVIPL